MSDNKKVQGPNRKMRRAHLAYRQSGKATQFHLSKEQVVMAMVGKGVMSNPRV